MLAADTDMMDGDVHANESRGCEMPRAPFVALCVYILSHAVAIPVMAIGPSWAVWPMPSDLALIPLAATCLASISSMRFVRDAQWKLLALLGIAFIGCFLSLLYMMAFLTPSPETKAVIFGGFQLVRLAEVIVVFWASSRIAITPSRHAILRHLAGITLLIAAGSIFATSFGIIAPESLTEHLPSDLDTAGPWHFYSLGEPARGWGLMGYNRAAVSAQVLLLLALYLRFADNGSSLLRSGAIALGLGACFLSGSRAGLAAAACFVLLVARPRESFMILAAGVAVLAYWMQTDQLPADLVALTEGHAALVRPTDEDSLNGRMDLWDEHAAYLKDNPILVVTGAGFGSVADLVDNAHCMPLQVLMELGLIGLMAWTVLVATALVRLYQLETGTRVIFFATIMLLVTSLTQETFYPIPAMGRFLDLYLCVFALTLSSSPQVKEATDE